MAKKPKTNKAADVDLSEVDPLDRVRAEVEKKWGNVMVSADAIMNKEDEIISIGPMVDGILSGGVPKGSWLSISGPPKCGKTITLLTLAANFQKYHEGKKRGGRVYYHNIEHRARRKNLGGIKGLDLNPRRFVPIMSDEDHILSAEDHLEIAIHQLRTDPECLLIFDSLSALVESDVLDGGLKEETRGGGAKLVTKFVNIVASTVPIRNSIVCGVNHLISDTGGGRGKVEKTSNRWIYQADIRLKLGWGEAWTVGGSKDKNGNMVGGREIGKKAHWICQESALGPPGMSCISYLRYNVGVDRTYEILEMAKAVPGLFSQKGNWLEFSFLEGQVDEIPKANGTEQAYRLLMKNPQWLDILQPKVMEFLRAPQEEL